MILQWEMYKNKTQHKIKDENALQIITYQSQEYWP